MTGTTTPGPLCQVLTRPFRTDDGTMCRCESPRPGAVGTDLSMFDHLTWGEQPGSYMEQERWFERRYPNLLENARVHFVKAVNDWVESHWGETRYDEKSPRISVHGRNKYESPRNKGVRWTATYMRDDFFEICGDQPQTFHEADAVLGDFAIDIETPIQIAYSTGRVRGQVANTYTWTSRMYVDDVMGIQSHDKIGGAFLRENLPSRRVKRAIWIISGEGYRIPDEVWKKHWVVKGDTLRGLAKKYYGDAAKWPILYKYNADTIGADPAKLRIATVLEIPDITRLSHGLVQQILSNPPKNIPGQPAVRGPELL
jgi:hypothetical protein